MLSNLFISLSLLLASTARFLLVILAKNFNSQAEGSLVVSKCFGKYLESLMENPKAGGYWATYEQYATEYANPAEP